MHKFLFYNKFIIFLYMFRAQQFSKHVEEYNTYYKTRHRTATYRMWRHQMLYNTIWSPDDEHNSAQNM